MNKRLYLVTYGCQMNERDSEEILGMLALHGYASTETAEDADVILLNTCSVREHAEERAFGKMGMLSKLKRERPDLILGILGCMAKAQRETIFKRLPQVDLIAGPAEIYDLPMLLAEVQAKRQVRGGGQGARGGGNHETRVTALDRPFRPLEQKPSGDFRTPGVSAFVTIMEGCDKRCSYCIVPMTRGQEVSRSPEEIVAEVRGLVEAGYKEVILLGQNVNSYGKRMPGGAGYRGRSWDERLRAELGETWMDFAELLRRIDRETGIGRIRFTTSHPFDAHQWLFDAMRDVPSVCGHLHLPVQSGSDRMLALMRRGYTVESYRTKVDALRRTVPEMALTTDIIVGFPGETDEDFQQTAALMDALRYDGAFIFRYSPRPGTTAADLADDVPEEIKEARNQELLRLQERISLEKNRALIGRTVNVLVEGPGKRSTSGANLMGRTRANKVVIFAGEPALAGTCVDVRVQEATPFTLIGESAVVTVHG